MEHEIRQRHWMDLLRKSTRQPAVLRARRLADKRSICTSTMARLSKYSLQEKPILVSLKTRAMGLRCISKIAAAPDRTNTTLNGVAMVERIALVGITPVSCRSRAKHLTAEKSAAARSCAFNTNQIATLVRCSQTSSPKLVERSSRSVAITTNDG